MPTTTAAAIASSPSPGTSTTARRRKPPTLLRPRAASSLQPAQRLAGRAVAASAFAGRRDRVVCKAKDASSATDNVGDVGEQTWDEAVLGCETAVLVEFWAPWCGPCRLMHPVIADLAKAYAGRLRCLRVNTDENHEVATRYGIRSIPTILIFSKGERKETIIGAVADTALAATVDRFL